MKQMSALAQTMQPIDEWTAGFGPKFNGTDQKSLSMVFEWNL